MTLAELLLSSRRALLRRLVPACLLAAAAFGVVGSNLKSISGIVSAFCGGGLLLGLAVVGLVQLLRLDKNPAMIEVRTPGTVVRVTEEKRYLRFLLQSGDEIRINSDAQQRASILDQIRNHSPWADVQIPLLPPRQLRIMSTNSRSAVRSDHDPDARRG